ncbi:hypothetical protein [Kaarinaea lacus]
MNSKTQHDNSEHKSVNAVKEEKWGQVPQDNYGYSTDEERRAKRGLEDWELLESVPQSQKGVPKWFIAVIVAVLLVAIGLSFPFWGDRPGYEREWINWGFGAALLYLAVFGAFVYFMVNKYSPNVDGMEDSAPTSSKPQKQNQDISRNESDIGQQSKANSESSEKQ